MNNDTLLILQLKKKIKDGQELSHLENLAIKQSKVLHLIDEVLISYSKGQSNGYDAVTDIRKYMNKYL